MKRLTLTWLMAATLGGCAHIQLPLLLTGPQPVDRSQIERWLEEAKFGQALDALAGADPSRPDYTELARLREHAAARAADYEQEVLTRTRQLIAEDDWAGALDLFDQALARLPRSSALKDGLAELHRRQQHATATQQERLLVDRAHWLLAALPEHVAVARITPRDPDALRRLDSHRREMRQIAQQLTVIGTTALEQGSMPRAEQLLELALSLHELPEARRGLEQVHSWYAERKRQRQMAAEQRKREAKRRQAELTRRVDALKTAYTSAFNDEQYAEAAALLEDLATAAPEEVDVMVERERLASAIDNRAAYLFEQGVIHYGREEFAKALELWQQVLLLRPDHVQAREHATRATRVLDKLRELREKQTAGI